MPRMSCMLNAFGSQSAIIRLDAYQISLNKKENYYTLLKVETDAK